MDKGPWKLFYGMPPEPRPVGVINEDFEHYVVLRVHGYFEDNNQRLAYCEWLLSKLNGKEGE